MGLKKLFGKNYLPQPSRSYQFCFFLIILFIYGRAGSLLLRVLFSSCSKHRLLSSFRVQAFIVVASLVEDHVL